MKLKPFHLAAAAAAAALSAAVAVPGLTSAQAGPSTTTVNVKVQAIAKDDLAPRSRARVSLGDRLVTRQSLFDGAGKRVGTLHTDCTGTGPTRPLPGATLLCTTSYAFSGGQIVAAGMFKLDGSGELVIVGGTGVYAGARGSVKSGPPARGYDSADVITITG